MRDLHALTPSRFQSSPSGRRETTACTARHQTTCRFQSSPSGRRETSSRSCLMISMLMFQSSPSGRRETKHPPPSSPAFKVSILSLRAEGDGRLPRLKASFSWFQSSPSGRRETPLVRQDPAFFLFQSSPSGRRETDFPMRKRRRNAVSILSLRAEGDTSRRFRAPIRWSFNPLPPGGGRPVEQVLDASVIAVSILSLRAEGDMFGRKSNKRKELVSILSLRAEGDIRAECIKGLEELFQSSPSGRRETSGTRFLPGCPDVSILSLRAEGDLTRFDISALKDVSILSLRAEGDNAIRGAARRFLLFQSSPSGRRETCSRSS